MSNRTVGFSIALLALSLPLGGCLEQVGTTINRGPTVDPASACAPGAYSHGETVNYGCPPAPTSRNFPS